MLNRPHSRTLSIAGAALPMYGDQPILTPVKLSGGEALGHPKNFDLRTKCGERI
jgi:hypothetical protein